MALIAADLFAALLGQRDIEHQDEHLENLSLSTRVYGMPVESGGQQHRALPCQ